MGIKKNGSNHYTAYERMMEELMSTSVGTEIMDQAMKSEDFEKNKSLPSRYRLIALGFLKQDTLEDLNDSLLNHKCQPLYARSSFESTLIYAFSNKLPYKEWKKICMACEKARDEWKKSSMAQNTFLNGKWITFGELEQYVLECSEVKETELVTKQITRIMNEQIQMLGLDYSEFFRFYASNMDEFSTAYEKSRYYFCKYLYYYILDKIEKYVVTVGEKVPSQEDLMNLLPLKADVALRRKKTPVSALHDVLRSCRITAGAIFEEFNYYYFEYVSLNWVELILEEVETVEDLNEDQIKAIAQYLRNIGTRSEKETKRKMQDFNVVEEKIRSLQSLEGDGEKSRTGEKAVRGYLRGELDIDRTTLISFLLFFGTSISNRNDVSLTVERLNIILDECGFSMLNRKDSFDRFVMKYIKSTDPVSCLMEEMDYYLDTGKPFFVYEVYKNSTSNAKDIRRLL